MVKRNFSNVKLVCNEKNLGYAKANNTGINYALKKYNPGYILLLNNDTIVVRPDWLKKMVEVAQKDNKIGIVGIKLLFPDGKIQHMGYLHKFIPYSTRETALGLGKRDAPEYKAVYEVEATTGACMLIKKEVITKIGLLDEIFSPYLCEDIDYCLRARKAGFKIMFTGQSKLIHLLSSTMRKCHLTDSDNLFFIEKRNSFILFKRHFTKKFLALALLISYLASIMTAKESFRPISFSNIRMRKNPLKKIYLTSKAFGDALKYE
jgi:GT2 family glycosyltransferase